MLPGIADRDHQDTARELVRQRARALEHGDRDLLDGVRRGLLAEDVDVREVVALGERARHAGARGEAFVDQRLRERAHSRAVAGGMEAIRRDEPGRLEDVGDELGGNVDVAPAGQRLVDAVARLRGTSVVRRVGLMQHAGA